MTTLKMASVKVLLNESRTNNEGDNAVWLVVIHERKRAIETLFYIDPKDWNERANQVRPNCPNAAIYNAILSRRLDECTKRNLQLENEGKSYSCHDVMKGSLGSQSLLLACIDDYRENVASSNARKYQNLHDKIQLFKPDTRLDQIDLDYMDTFKKWLKAQDKIKSMETVNRYLKFLKTILHRQHKKKNYDNRDVLAYSTPMGRGQKMRLTREELHLMATATLGEHLELSRDCFCLMVYMRGIRISDMLQLKASDISSGRVSFREQKTGKSQDIKLIPEALEIISRYEGQSLWYVLPILMMEPDNPRENSQFQKHIEVKTSQVNRDLKLVAAVAGVKKKVSTHVARHTFATWADNAGLTSREIQKMLNHSSLSVTENYLDGIRKSNELDDAADKVFGNVE